jgi:protoheme IX farnesyltransferase
MLAKGNVTEIGIRDKSGVFGCRAAIREKLVVYFALTKPRVTLMVTLISAAAFYLGSPSDEPLNGSLLFHTLAATWLLGSGIACLNQYLERTRDGLMRRTLWRPLPSRRLRPMQALLFGLSLTIMAELYLALCAGGLATLLGLSVIVGYLFLYTPLKTRTPHSTTIGAIPGAIPPLIGWAAARGRLGAEAWALFAIMFLWQFPHFFAIARLYREDYERAGIRMLPVVETDGRRTARYIVCAALLLVPVSLLPTLLGLTGGVYFAGALGLGIAYCTCSVIMSQRGFRASKLYARRLMLASVVYLPLLFFAMVVNKR